LLSGATPDSRTRIRAAVMDLVVERGFDGTTVEMVVARAGVDREDFERDFGDLRECCMAIYRENIEDFNQAVFGAAAGPDPWRDRLRAAAYAAARYIDARPIQTRFDMIQMLGVGDMAQAYRDRYLGEIVNLIDEGRTELPDPDSMSRDVAIGVFGSIYQFLLRELEGRREPVTAESYVPQLMYIAVRPYLGHDAAREELTIEAPPSSQLNEAGPPR
jgi:TetR/AcrR family transcriptional regulator, repressor of fatR-cypB operon